MIKCRLGMGRIVLGLLVAVTSATADGGLDTTTLFVYPPVGAGTPLTLTVEVATTPDQRRRGLSHRATLAAGSGMLFVFPTTRRACMWMKNTRIPLTAAFLNAQGVIVQTTALTPRDTTLRCAATPVRAVLETAPDTLPDAVVGGRVDLAPFLHQPQE